MLSADLKVGEQDIKTKYSNRNSFEVTTDLHNSDSIKVAITQLLKMLQVCNFTILQLTQEHLNNIFIQNAANVIVFKLQLINSRMRT